MTETNIQTLESLINAYKDEHYKINFTNLSEEESATILNYMLQLFDLDSCKFEEIYLQVGIPKYCNISVIRDIKQLCKVPSNAEERKQQKQLISRLVNYSIDGVCFKKYIYSAIIDVILRFRLLREYVEFVDMALQVVKDKTIPNITLFLNTER